MHFNKQTQNTSWQQVSGWYNNLVRDEGHYYHKLIIPECLKLLKLDKNSSVLDLACGQGVLARHLPSGIYYTGIDSSESLIKSALIQDKNKLHHYAVGDLTKPVPLEKNNYTHAAIILALQNIADPLKVLQTAALHLKVNGKMIIILNHPCFRIPRQSSWGIDESNKMQYRKINRYMTPLKIPITMHPGKQKSPVTWSFHFPLSVYSDYLSLSGFVIERLEEWTSDKLSVGKAARMENRARSEFPLFLAILARKDR